MPSAMPSTGNGVWPRAHQTATPRGTIPSDAASIPIVAARSGSPAVLSLTFQARWRTAETATRPMIQGSTPRTLPADVPPRQAECADRHAPDAHHRRHDDPERVEDPGDRLAEVLVE